MRISDLDYLEPLSETSAIHLKGGTAGASSKFLAFASGNSTNTSTFVKNRAISEGRGSFASSSVRVTSIATGDGNNFAQSSASSAAFVS